MKKYSSFLFMLCFSFIHLTCGGDDGTTNDNTNAMSLGEITVHGTMVDDANNTAALLITNESVDEVFTLYVDLNDSGYIQDVHSIYVVDTETDEFQRLLYGSTNLPEELYDSATRNTFQFSNITFSGLDVRIVNADDEEIDSYEYEFANTTEYQQATLFQTLPFTAPPLTGLEPTYEFINALQVDLTEGQIRAAKAVAYGVGVGVGVFACGVAAGASAGAAAVACAGLAVTILSGPCTIECGASGGLCDALNVAGIGFSGTGCVGDVLETVVGNKGAIVNCLTGAAISAVQSFEPVDPPSPPGDMGFSFEENPDCGGSTSRLYVSDEANPFRALGW